jgi:hypothetical protein
VRGKSGAGKYKRGKLNAGPAHGQRCGERIQQQGRSRLRIALRAAIHRALLRAIAGLDCIARNRMGRRFRHARTMVLVRNLRFRAPMASHWMGHIHVSRLRQQRRKQACSHRHNRRHGDKSPHTNRDYTAEFSQKAMMFLVKRY